MFDYSINGQCNPLAIQSVCKNDTMALLSSSSISAVPVTSAWRDELEKKTQNAILRAMGQPLPSRESMGSQMGFRRENQFDHLQDEKVCLN